MEKCTYHSMTFAKSHCWVVSSFFHTISYITKEISPHSTQFSQQFYPTPYTFQHLEYRIIIKNIGILSNSINALLHDSLCFKWCSFDRSAFSLLIVLILHTYMMDWPLYNGSLVRRGQVLLDFDVLNGWV